MDSIAYEPQIGGFGALIKGVDLAQPLDQQAINEIKTIFATYHVLIFRGQQLTPDQQIGFGKQFGPLVKHPYIKGLDDCPEIMVVEKKETDKHNFAGAWHTDTSYQEIPALASMLYAREIPPSNLGNTLFCNLVAAYEALSKPLQEFLIKLKAVHSFTGRSMAGREQDLGYGQLAKNRTDQNKVLQPVIRRHPESFKLSLYVNPMFTEYIEGLNPDESDLILDYLFQHCIKSEFVFRLCWTPDTLIVWDNLTTMHNPINDYDGYRRLMHRVVVAGSEKSGVSLYEAV